MPDMRPAGDFTIAPDHPSLDGHFPGNPVVPGVIVLDTALARIGAELGLGTPLLLARVKFSLPVLPGQRVEVTHSPGLDQVGFACHVEGRLAVAGVATFAAAP